MRWRPDRIGAIAPSYKRNYKLMIKVGKAYWNTRDVRTIKNYDVINYDKHLQAIGYVNPNTRKKYLDHFRSFMNYCRLDRQIPGLTPLRFPELDTTESSIPWLNLKNQ